MNNETTNKFIEEIKETFNQNFNKYEYLKEYYLEANGADDFWVHFTIQHKKYGEQVRFSVSYSYVIYHAETINSDFLADFLVVDCWQNFHDALIKKIRNGK